MLFVLGSLSAKLGQRPNSRDAPRFAPNFTVYVLPPDVVCLYSEDRKFFPHGELYCALAGNSRSGSAISFRNLLPPLPIPAAASSIRPSVLRGNRSPARGVSTPSLARAPRSGRTWSQSTKLSAAFRGASNKDGPGAAMADASDDALLSHPFWIPRVEPRPRSPGLGIRALADTYGLATSGDAQVSGTGPSRQATF